MAVKVAVAKSEDIDERLPEGEFLVEVLPNGEVHLAFRGDRYERWGMGTWEPTKSG